MSATTTGATPATTPADGATPEAPVTPAEGATPESNQETIESLPEWAQKAIKDLRKENEKRRKAIDDERTQAEEKRLADEKKWQELAEARAAERDELKPFKERYEALAAARRTELMAEVKAWPAEVKALLPGEDAEVTVLADAVTKARPLVQALAGKQEATPGQGATPKPSGTAKDAATRAEAQRSSANMYSTF